jgi:hypothetical protein
VEFVLSPFQLQFQLSDSTTSIPSTVDFAEVEAQTIGYIEEFLELTYSANKMIYYEKVEIEVTSRRTTSGTSMTAVIDFEASVAFASNSPMSPTSEEIALTIAEAFSPGTSLSTYLFSLRNRLGGSNPFLTTTQVGVYVPDSSSNSSNGRVANNPKEFDTAGIAAALSTGALTLLVGGFLLFKIKRENEDLQGGKFGKGYAGGATLAGDTYDTSTLEPSATLPHEDGGSLDASYQDDRSLLFSTPPDIPDIRKRVAEAENVEEARSDTDSMPFDCSQGPTGKNNEDHGEGADDEDEDSDDDTNEDASVERFHDEEVIEDSSDSPLPKPFGTYASLVVRTKALVPSFNQSVPMSNVDIKNYFKAKYHCISPLGDDAVDKESSPADDDLASVGDEASLDLTLPALDHDTVASSKKESNDKYEDDNSRSQPSIVFPRQRGLGAEASLGGDEVSIGEQDHAGSLPTEIGGGKRSRAHQWEARSVGRSFDEISLDTMATLTEI